MRKILKTSLSILLFLPAAISAETLLPALEKLGYKGIYLGTQESEAMAYTKNLGCETAERGGRHFALCSKEGLSMSLSFHPLNHKLYYLFVIFHGLGEGGRELLLERLTQKYGKPTGELYGSITWEFKDGKRIDFVKDDTVVYQDTQTQKDAERAEAKRRLGDL